MVYISIFLYFVSGIFVTIRAFLAPETLSEEGVSHSRGSRRCKVVSTYQIPLSLYNETAYLSLEIIGQMQKFCLCLPTGKYTQLFFSYLRINYVQFFFIYFFPIVPDRVLQLTKSVLFMSTHIMMNGNVSSLLSSDNPGPLINKCQITQVALYPSTS